MPVRTLEDAISATRTCQKISESGETAGILDGDDEYDIYEGDDIQVGEAVSSIVAENSRNEFVQDRQLPSVDHAPPSPVQPQSSSAGEHPRRPVAQVEHDVIAVTPTVPVTQPVTLPPQQEESIHFPQEALNLAAEEARLIEALQTTNERAQREKLTVELLNLFQRSESMASSAIAEESSHVAQNGTSKSAYNDITVVTSLNETESDNDQHGGDKMQAAASKITTSDNTAQCVQRQQDQTSEVKTQQPVGRKTPPHLRGVVTPWRPKGN